MQCALSAHCFWEGSRDCTSPLLPCKLCYQRTGNEILQLLVLCFCLLRAGVKQRKAGWERESSVTCVECSLEWKAFMSALTKTTLQSHWNSAGQMQYNSRKIHLLLAFFFWGVSHLLYNFFFFFCHSLIFSSSSPSLVLLTSFSDCMVAALQAFNRPQKKVTAKAGYEAFCFSFPETSIRSDCFPFYLATKPLIILQYICYKLCLYWQYFRLLCSFLQAAIKKNWPNLMEISWSLAWS